MLLYELAISLDKRSPELVEAAAALGLGELLPASEVDAAQVAALRAHFGGQGAPPPLAPLGAPAGSPHHGAGAPLTFPPPGAQAPPPPPGAGPGTWAPPTAPPTWGAPTEAPPTPAGGHPGPQFAYPAGPTAAPAPGPAHFAPPAPPPPQAPTSWGAPGSPGSPITPGGPGAPDGGRTGMGRGQIVAIAVAGVLVLGLFAFMVSNTGPDQAREQAISDGAAELEAELAATTTIDPSATTTQVPTTTVAKSVTDPVDVERFCRGGLAVSTFELRLVAAMVDQDFAEMTQLVNSRRSGWQDDVSLLASGAPPSLLQEIERYQSVYNGFFDAIESSSSWEQAMSKVDQIELAKGSNAAREFGRQIQFLCA